MTGIYIQNSHNNIVYLPAKISAAIAPLDMPNCRADLPPKISPIVTRINFHHTEYG